MDLDQSRQDVLRCHLCETPVPELYCKLCRFNLCKNCAGKHLLDESKLHDVVPIKQKWYPTNPTNPECFEHSNKRCELFCKQCDIPICAYCVSTQEHKHHDVVEIFKHFEHAKQSLIKDLQELVTSIYPRYDEISSLIPVQKYHLRKNLNSVMKVLVKHRKKWHDTIENVVEVMRKKIVKLNSTQLMELERQESEINHNTTNLSQFIQYLQNLEENNDFLNISKYKSRIDEFRKLPPCLKISLLAFVPSTIGSSQFFQQFGSLSEYPLTKEEIVTEFKHKEDISSSEDSRVTLEDVYDLLDNLELSPLYQKDVYGNEESVIEYQEDELSTLCLKQLDHFEFYTGDNSLTNIACQSDEKIWTTNAGKFIKLYNFHGELLMSVPSKSEIMNMCKHAVSSALCLIICNS
uniref:E3 ubiquitin-protein ligase TRIM36-like n=1 Tax=Crassostrea virginica TaxID=6565 RepID=A0A8B8BNI5_CRAVI|nr:E3 ubiquitin-protein ligase TRIM36-like [Crassostrea virginica]